MPKKPTKPRMPELAEILDKLDFNAVAAAILASPVNDRDFQDAKAMVWTLAENFAARDLEDMDLVGVERYIEVPAQDTIIRGYIDVAGVLKSNRDPFIPYRDQKVIVDWKTTRGELGTAWKERLVHSWQWKMYAAYEGAALAIYRGVNLDGETREIIIDVPKTIAAEVDEWTKGLVGQRRSLIDLGLEVWPRKFKGFACDAFGRECPYLGDCENYSMPRASVPIRTMSYSQFEIFSLCEERSRRMVLEENEGSDENENTMLGSAVHRGVEELYLQLAALQGRDFRVKESVDDN